MEIKNEILEKYEKAMLNEEILKGTVMITQNSKELNTPILILNLEGIKAIIPKEYVDCEFNWKSLVSFVGREIYFVVKEIDRDNGVLICSRSDAQLKIKPELIVDLNNGKSFNATVVKHLDYGAYIDIKGISGLLKNVDFADDHTKVKDKLKIGDKIEVKLIKKSNNEKLVFEAVEKYKDPTIMNFDIFEKDQVICGVVSNTKPWGCFVNIGPKVDALCPPPEGLEVETGLKVAIKIKVVDKENQNVRGKILQVC